MHGHQQCRCGDKNQLQGPESDVRDGEKVIIANISAPRLKRVADKVILFISPDSLRSHNQDHDTEDEEDCEPYLPDTGGVFIYTSQNSMQSSPIHCLVSILCPKTRQINKTKINKDRKQISASM
uniref:Uncharacterized protein n=1 Tax=Catharus ustulatus TaxID=91951 RepID=A0A8C3Y2W2_CATUS